MALPPNLIQPSLDLLIAFDVGAYTAVVSGSTNNIRTFVIQILDPFHVGTLVAGSAQNWLAPLNPTNCSDYTMTPSAFFTHTFVHRGATTDATYDITVHFTHIAKQVVVALYQGIFPGNFSTPHDPYTPCDVGVADGGGLGRLLDVGIEQGSTLDAVVPLVHLTSGNTYTIVVSCEVPSDNSPFGIFIAPTIFGNTSDSDAIYTAPEISNLVPFYSCIPSNFQQKFQLTTFVAQHELYIIGTNYGSSFDDAVVLYRRAYTRNTPPQACDEFVAGGDTGDGGVCVCVSAV